MTPSMVMEVTVWVMLVIAPIPFGLEVIAIYGRPKCLSRIIFGDVGEYAKQKKGGK